MSTPDRQELRRAIEADIREHHPLLSPAWTHEWVESLLASLDRLGFCVVPTGDAERQPSTSEMAYSVQRMADPYQAAKEVRHGRG